MTRNVPRQQPKEILHPFTLTKTLTKIICPGESHICINIDAEVIYVLSRIKIKEHKTMPNLLNVDLAPRIWIEMFSRYHQKVPAKQRDSEISYSLWTDIENFHSRRFTQVGKSFCTLCLFINSIIINYYNGNSCRYILKLFSQGNNYMRS